MFEELSFKIIFHKCLWQKKINHIYLQKGKTKKIMRFYLKLQVKNQKPSL